jgi:NADPH:quinone reductase-like Zn-dependent oxidoreductase
MKAVLLYEFGGPDKLIYQDTDVPPYGDDEVLVRVRATSINPIDWKLRSGASKLRTIHLPAILGRDLAGEVAAFGSKVTGLKEGARVMALAWGTYAEFAVAKAEILAPIPDALSFEQAAALPLVVTTGSQLIERAIKPTAGQSVLVTGALGGVGRTAVYVALEHAVRVFAGVRVREKQAAAALKADGILAIDDDAEIAKISGLDGIADTVDGATILSLLKAIRPGGVLGSVLGTPDGAKNFPIRVEAILSISDGPRLGQLAEEVARGEFSIPIARTMKLADIQEAHRIAEKGGLGGKIIIVP